jgi:hypothetical protein
MSCELSPKVVLDNVRTFAFLHINDLMKRAKHGHSLANIAHLPNEHGDIILSAREF